MIWTKDSIIQILKIPQGRTDINGKWHKNSELIYRMLQALYARQTYFEQAAKSTMVDNGIGFNAFDSGFLSSVAEASKKYKDLTPKQTEHVAKRLIKYASQLDSIAQEKQQVKLPVCGYCSEVGHVQADCPQYNQREMGRPAEQIPLVQMEYPD